MEPNQNMPNTAGVQNVPNPQMRGASTGGDIVLDNSGKKGKGMAICMICLAILAVAGIGFGVWAFLDGNQQKTELNNQINSLNAQIQAKDAEIEELKAAMESDADATGAFSTEDGTVNAEVVEGVFYLKDQNGEIITQDNTVAVNEIVMCASGIEGESQTFECQVTTADGNSGTFVYDIDLDLLTFNPAADGAVDAGADMNVTE